MKHLAKIIIALSLIASFSTTQAKKVPSYPIPANELNTTDELQKYVEDMKKVYGGFSQESTKITIDLNSVNANKPVMVMVIKMMTVTPDSSEAEAIGAVISRQALTQQLRQYICSDPQSQILIEKNVRYTHIITDQDDNEVFITSIDLGEC